MRAGFGILAGLLLGIAVVALVESAGHALFPPPAGIDPRSPASLRAIMGDVPLPAKIAVLIAWGAGVLAGGTLAGWIARGRAWPAYVIGAALLAMGAWTMAMIPHPWWMWAGALLITIAAAFAAGRLAARLSPARSA